MINFHIFTVSVNMFLKALTGDFKKCEYFYQSIFIRKAEPILERQDSKYFSNVDKYCILLSHIKYIWATRVALHIKMVRCY